jgi:hypothetical protein
MVNVRVSIDLPYLLLLPVGEYPTPGEGGSVQLQEISATDTEEITEPKTMASTVFVANDGIDARH